MGCLRWLSPPRSPSPNEELDGADATLSLLSGPELSLSLTHSFSLSLSVFLSLTLSLPCSLRSPHLHHQSPLPYTHKHTQDYLSACLLTVSSPSPLARSLDQSRLGSAHFDPEPVVVVVVAVTAGNVRQMNGPKVNFPKGRSLQVCNAQGHLARKWCHYPPTQPTHPPH